MSDEPQTPSPLDAMSKTDSDRVSKLDILIGYARQTDARVSTVLARLAKGDQRMTDQDRRIEALEKKIGRKTKPEPHWSVRAAAISAMTVAIGIVVKFVFLGGFAAGVH